MVHFVGAESVKSGKPLVILGEQIINSRAARSIAYCDRRCPCSSEKPTLAIERLKTQDTDDVFC